MNYCTNCGRQIDKNAYVCLNCGVKITNEEVLETHKFIDSGGFLWSVLGFFAPLVGLILYLVWKNEKPKTAKSVGKGALFYVIGYVIIIVFIFIGAFIYGFNSETDNNYYEEEHYIFE